MEDTAQRMPRYFAAANSADGFRCFYRERFDSFSFQKIYILKGGPGTGKSKLLREACRMGTIAGYEPEQILCSSDPSSLDGVILSKDEKKLALLDGTAPHVRDADYPGFCDTLFDLGAFWDENKLASERKDIETAMRGKKDAYAAAYRFLAAAGIHERHRLDLLTRCADKEKMLRYARKLLPDGPTVLPPAPEYRLRRAISMAGPYETDCYKEKNCTLFSVYGAHGASAVLLEALRQAGKEKGLSVCLSPAPLLPDTLDAIAFPSLRLAFCDDGRLPDPEAVRRVNSERFLKEEELRRVKPLLRRLSSLRDASLASAYEALADAGKSHFLLEKIYGGAMDFEAKEKAENTFLRRILGI